MQNYYLSEVIHYRVGTYQLVKYPKNMILVEQDIKFTYNHHLKKKSLERINYIDKFKLFGVIPKVIAISPNFHNFFPNIYIFV